MKRKFKIFVCLLAFFISITKSANSQTKDSLNSSNDGFESPSWQPADSFRNLNDTGAVNITMDDSDKIMKWRSSREFAYIHYLDSLLRKQKVIRSDSVSVNENSGKIIRKHQSDNEDSAFNKVLNSLPLKIFFWILALIFIGLTGYKVLFKNGIFIRNKTKIKQGSGEDLSSELDGFSKYDALIVEAEKHKDFNLSIRYLFLETLKTLSDRDFISLVPDKTNREYLDEMKSSEYFKEFLTLTRNYEYLWYGKFLIEEKDYHLLKEKFILFNKKV
jgi:hypothetical protein